MAITYRRVQRLSNRETVARRGRASVALRDLLARVLVLAAVLLAAATSRAQSDEWSRSRIETYAADLRSDDAATRRAAIEALRTLPPEALEAIRDRVRYTRRQIVPAEDGLEALRTFRHATGSRRADDMVDIAPGIETVLRERRDATVTRSAERVLLIRALEGMGTLEGLRTIGDVFSLTNEMWRWEQRRIVARVGARIFAGLLLARGHADRGVRRWSREGTRALGLQNPAAALQADDLAILRDRIVAYAEVRDLEAMPVIISYVDHPDAGVRDAARAAMERFGRNGIWMLREAMRNRLGERADENWGWQRTMRALFEGLDAARLAPFVTRIDEAEAALGRGEVAEATALLDELLRDAPEPPDAARVATLYDRLAQAAEGRSARRFLQRALWLAPDAAEASSRRARLDRNDADEDRARGVLDLPAYEAALRQDADDATARELVQAFADEETSEALAPESGGELPWAALLLALATLALAAAGWRFRSRVRAWPARLPALPARLGGLSFRSGSFVQVLTRVWHSLRPPSSRRSRRRVARRPSPTPKPAKPRAPIDAAFVFGSTPVGRTPETVDLPAIAPEPSTVDDALSATSDDEPADHDPGESTLDDQVEKLDTATQSVEELVAPEAVDRTDPTRALAAALRQRQRPAGRPASLDALVLANPTPVTVDTPRDPETQPDRPAVVSNDSPSDAMAGPADTLPGGTLPE